MATNYSCKLYESIDDVDLEEWESICSHADNLYLNPRFLKAVELSFTPDAKIWYAVFRDKNGKAVAANCFSQYFLDCESMSPPMLRRLISSVRQIWPSFAMYRILFGSLPISLSDNQLALSPDANEDWIVADLCEIAQKLAKENRCRFTYFKDFNPDWVSRIGGIEEYGFFKLQSQFAYCLHGEFGSFVEYLKSLRSGTRASVRNSLKRFEKAGLTREELRGRDGIEHIFTPEVYQLYVNVFNHADIRLELIPIKFFYELARQLPDDSRFTIFRQNEKIVGFCCGLGDDHQYSVLYGGRDYSVGQGSDLYFNLVYGGLNQALAPGIKKVYFGSTSDTLKQRMGCEGVWLTAYIKAKRSIGTWILKQIISLMFKTDAPEQDNSEIP